MTKSRARNTPGTVDCAVSTAFCSAGGFRQAGAEQRQRLYFCGGLAVRSIFVELIAGERRAFDDGTGGALGIFFRGKEHGELIGADGGGFFARLGAGFAPGIGAGIAGADAD